MSWGDGEGGGLVGAELLVMLGAVVVDAVVVEDVVVEDAVVDSVLRLVGVASTVL